MTDRYRDDDPDERDREDDDQHDRTDTDQHDRDEPTFEQLADARRRHRLGDRVVDDAERERNGGAA